MEKNGYQKYIIAGLNMFDCGCKFEIKNGQPIIDFDLNKINLDCKLTWDLIGSGKTIGLFQIDSPLGQMMSKKLKPENIHHLAALIAILRPSCLQGVLDDGKSIANHFIDRKNNLEPSMCKYQALASILKDTYNLLIFQEQTIQIGQEIAGMDLATADELLRKGIGKKKADILTKAKQVFLEGCYKVGKVSDNEAKEIWEWIFSAARYQFNASHSYGYAMTTYTTALVKAHFPLRFFKSWLNHSIDKMKPLDEIKNLVNDARSFDIQVNNPDLRLKNDKFIIKDGQIYFGLQYIKGVGESAFNTLVALVDAISQNQDLEHLSWCKMLCMVLLRANRAVVKHLIAVGALDYLKIARERLLFEHDIALKFSKKEIEWIICNINLQQHTSIETVISHILTLPTGKNQPIANKNRKNIINNLLLTLVKLPFSVIDNIDRICALESSYLGVPLKFHKTDSSDKGICDTTCREIQEGKRGKLTILAEILKINETVSKKSNKKMCFLSVEDSTGTLENIVLFEESLERFRNNLFMGNVVLLSGYISKFNSLVVQNCQNA